MQVKMAVALLVLLCIFNVVHSKSNVMLKKVKVKVQENRQMLIQVLARLDGIEAGINDLKAKPPCAGPDAGLKNVVCRGTVLIAVDVSCQMTDTMLQKVRAAIREMVLSANSTEDAFVLYDIVTFDDGIYQSLVDREDRQQLVLDAIEQIKPRPTGCLALNMDKFLGDVSSYNRTEWLVVPNEERSMVLVSSGYEIAYKDHLISEDDVWQDGVRNPGRVAGNTINLPTNMCVKEVTVEFLGSANNAEARIILGLPDATPGSWDFTPGVDDFTIRSTSGKVQSFSVHCPKENVVLEWENVKDGDDQNRIKRITLKYQDCPDVPENCDNFVDMRVSKLEGSFPTSPLRDFQHLDYTGVTSAVVYVYNNAKDLQKEAALSELAGPLIENSNEARKWQPTKIDTNLFFSTKSDVWNADILTRIRDVYCEELDYDYMYYGVK